MGVDARETPWVLRPKGRTEGRFGVLAKMAQNPYTPRYVGVAPGIPWVTGPNRSQNLPRVRASETRPAGHSGCPSLGGTGRGGLGLGVPGREVHEHRHHGHPNRELPGRVGLYWATKTLCIVAQYSPALHPRVGTAGGVELRPPASPSRGNLGCREHVGGPPPVAPPHVARDHAATLA